MGGNNKRSNLCCSLRKLNMVSIGLIGLICGILVCATTTFAATTLNIHFLHRYNPDNNNHDSSDVAISSNNNHDYHNMTTINLFETPTRTKPIYEMMSQRLMVEYIVLNLIMTLGYVVYYFTCLSSIFCLLWIVISPLLLSTASERSSTSSTLSKFLIPSHDGCNVFVKTLSFQCGFFAGIALTFLILQTLLLSSNGRHHHHNFLSFMYNISIYDGDDNDEYDQQQFHEQNVQMFTFVAACIDRLLMALIISCFLLGATMKMIKKTGPGERMDVKEEDDVVKSLLRIV